MRFIVALTLFAGLLPLQGISQRVCDSYTYQEERLRRSPRLRDLINPPVTAGFPGGEASKLSVITIPVVVHMLYHYPGENIPDEQVHEQIRVLNESFRRLGADTAKTPARFLPLAADAGIEFKLAISDPRSRNTTGIVRKYTPVTVWDTNDLMKKTSETGDDPWDAGKYLNIWVVNLGRTAGYSTFPGDDPLVDGVVLSHAAFGLHPGSFYEFGKTAVHEVGHWLGLRHIWGDALCGDDGIADTPTQSNFTMVCPSSGFQFSCNNGADGDMFMNYMDLTVDACTNMFTQGQAERMRGQFAAGGLRQSILSSAGLLPPLINEIPIREDEPQWLSVHLYPNPAREELIIDFSGDIRWLGKQLTITNAQGVVVSQTVVAGKITRLDLSRFKPGYYFISGRRENGSKLQLKFIKI